MNRNLIVLTDKYPFGLGETFIEPERKYWYRFDRVFICPVLVRKTDRIRDGFMCGQNETLIKTFDDRPSLLSIISHISGAITPGEALSEMKTRKDIPLASRAKLILLMAAYTNLRVERIFKALSGELAGDLAANTLLYSYWMYEPALVAAGMIRAFLNARFITRAHGYDLYEERHPNNYIPFRKLVFDAADAIYSISQDGKNYIHERYGGKYDHKTMTARLGTVKFYDTAPDEKKPQRLVFVSCSNMVALKRIDRIMDALKLFREEVEWHHFGDGELMESIQAQAAELPSNVHAHFWGRIPNIEVQKFYSENQVSLFLNVSEAEGIPVSIMEAQSYGIPVVATNVGGTAELVHDGENGILLDKDFSSPDLKKAIYQVIDNMELYRSNALRTWKERSNAEELYSNYFATEYSLLTKKKTGDEGNARLSCM